jgi:hypothetical protein
VPSRFEEITKAFAAENSWKRAKEKSAKYKAQRNRSTPISAPGPPSWRKFDAKHREVLTIPLDPPGNEPDVTQNGKGRQCVSAESRGALLRTFLVPQEFGRQGKKKCNKRLRSE